MDRMLLVVFDNENKAYEGKKALLQLDCEGSIGVYAYAVVAKTRTEPQWSSKATTLALSALSLERLWEA